ncbi:MAG: OmpA family protein [Actinobacteria bacterium]|uniref:Unannotated protein n=1 Tax=freshwater metagenome TaxID=449393 RepID=A0A6J5YL88_9ZZZZ|nr:OmpA family protein [Actinomycetota bacterium]
MTDDKKAYFEMKRFLAVLACAFALTAASATSSSAEISNSLATTASPSSSSQALSFEGKIKFSVKSAKLTKASKTAIRAIVAKNPKYSTYKVTGYVQLLGRDKNSTLSLKRARAVRAYLQTLGVKGEIEVSRGSLPRAQARKPSARKATIYVLPKYSLTYVGTGASSGTAPTDSLSPYVNNAVVSVKGNTGSLTKVGHLFSGWTLSADGTGPIYTSGSTFIISSDSALYAKWARGVYTVSYDVNGGTGTTPSDQTYTYDDPGVTLDDGTGLSRDHYIFDGWSVSGATPAETSPFTTDADVTLKAIWTPDVYTITYDRNNGGGTTPSDDSYTYGESGVTLDDGSSMSLDHYYFDGWSVSGAAPAVSQPFTTDADVTLKAIWTPDDYTISYDINSGSGTTPSDQTYTYGDAPGVTLADDTGISRDHYSFDGWSVSGSLPSETSPFTTDADVTLKAIWTPDEYTISYDINGGTGTTPSDQTYTYDESGVTLDDGTGLSLDHYIFDGWSVSGATPAETSPFTTDADVTLKAIWTPDEYTITYDLNGGSGTTPSDQTYTYGDPGVTLDSSTPTRVVGSTRFYFDGWSASGSLPAATNLFTTDADVTLKAIWTRMYSITYDANQATSGSAPSVQYEKPATGSITLESNSQSLQKTGYTFNGWNTQRYGLGTHYDSGLTTFTLGTSNVRLYAEWQAIAYHVTYSLSNSAATWTVPSAPVVTDTSTYSYDDVVDVDFSELFDFGTGDTDEYFWATSENLADPSTVVYSFNGTSTFNITADTTLYLFPNSALPPPP